MKPPFKKSAAIAAILGVAVVAGSMLVHAQETAASGTTTSPDSIVALAADSQSLPPVAPSSVPARGGTFWWVYPGGLAVPTPMLPLDSSGPIYRITPDEFMVDLTGGTALVTPYELKQAAQVTANPYAAAVTAQVQGLVEIITKVQTPPPATTTATSTTASAMTLTAKQTGGGFSPEFQQQSGIPYLTIAPTGTNGLFLITVFNNTGPQNYEIWYTPILANASYPWTAVAAGTTGVTNFFINIGSYYTGFFRAYQDTNLIPLWEAANPANPGAGVLSVFIDSPTNGAVLQ